MPASIDTTNGVSSFVSAKEDAWHSLGVTLPDTFTAEEAMKVGHLGGWNVRKQPLWTTGADGSPLVIPGRNAVVRTNPVDRSRIDVLGDVGDTYHIIQNEEHAGFLNALVEESGAHFETAGALDRGRRVFITMKLPSHIMIGGVDRVDTYIAAVNSHDGGSSFVGMVTPIRIVCANTLNMAFNNNSHIVRIRHTAGAAKTMVAEARRVLEFSFKFLDGFQEEADRLINTSLTQQRFEEIIAKEFGAAEDAAPSTVTRTENKLDQMAELFADAFTQEGVRGTAWAGLNALTEWYDHFSPVRGSTPEESRATKALLAPEFKNRARDLMLAV